MRLDRDGTGIYLHNTTRPVDSLAITLGARQQHITQKAYDYNTGTQTSSYETDKLTPMAGLIAHARTGRLARGEPVVFLHSGGTPGLFVHAETIARSFA